MTIKRIALVSIAMTGLCTTSIYSVDEKKPVTALINNSTKKSRGYGILQADGTYKGDLKNIRPGKKTCVTIDYLPQSQVYEKLLITGRGRKEIGSYQPSGRSEIVYVNIEEDDTLQVNPVESMP